MNETFSGGSYAPLTAQSVTSTPTGQFGLPVLTSAQAVIGAPEYPNSAGFTIKVIAINDTENSITLTASAYGISSTLPVEYVDGYSNFGGQSILVSPFVNGPAVGSIQGFNASGFSALSTSDLTGSLRAVANFVVDPPPVISPTTTQTTLFLPAANASVAGSGLDVLNLGNNLASSYTLTANGEGGFNLAGNNSTNNVVGVLQVEFGDKAETNAPANSIYEDVALLYQGALGRTPDPAGLADWDRIASGLPASAAALGPDALSDIPGGYAGNASIASGFTTSPEFVAKYGALSNAAFVAQLYANVLDRTPDPAGLNGSPN